MGDALDILTLLGLGGAGGLFTPSEYSSNSFFLDRDWETIDLINK